MLAPYLPAPHEQIQVIRGRDLTPISHDWIMRLEFARSLEDEISRFEFGRNVGWDLDGVHEQWTSGDGWGSRFECGREAVEMGEIGWMVNVS